MGHVRITLDHDGTAVEITEHLDFLATEWDAHRALRRTVGRVVTAANLPPIDEPTGEAA